MTESNKRKLIKNDSRILNEPKNFKKNFLNENWNELGIQNKLILGLISVRIEFNSNAVEMALVRQLNVKIDCERNYLWISFMIFCYNP